MKDKIDLLAILLATIASIIVGATLAAAHFAVTSATTIASDAFDALRGLGWPDL